MTTEMQNAVETETARVTAKPATKAKPVTPKGKAAKGATRPAKSKLAAKGKMIKGKAAKGKAAARQARALYDTAAKISVLPDGKENPCRKGTGRWKRYEALLASKNVGDFLSQHPHRQSTIRHYVATGLIAVR